MLTTAARPGDAGGQSEGELGVVDDDLGEDAEVLPGLLVASTGQAVDITKNGKAVILV